MLASSSRNCATELLGRPKIFKMANDDEDEVNVMSCSFNDVI